MSGCNKCKPHSCGCAPKLDVWTRPLTLGREDPHCHTDCASPCEPPIDLTACHFSWSITPIQNTAGGTVTFSGVNLPANAIFQVHVVGTNTNYYWTINADAAGVANATMTLPLEVGSYQFTPIVHSCRALPASNSVSVVASGPITPGSCNCLGNVVILPSFLTQNGNIYAGTQVPLILTITNTNSCPATEINMPQLVLPTGLTNAGVGTISLSNITVPGNSTQTFTYLLNATNNTNADLPVSISVPAQTSSYKCANVTFFAGGGSAYASIKSTVTGSCNLIVEEFSVAPAAIANGGSATYTLKIKNTGTNAISNLQFGPLSLVSGIVTSSPPVSLAGVSINLAAGATHTTTATANFTAAPLASGQQHGHQVLIPAGAITATCNFGQISNMMPAANTLIING